MTTTTPRTPPAASAPTEGRGLRIGFWVAIVLVGILLAAITAAVGRTGPDRTPLDPTSATASGTKALVRVLEQRGTDVRIVGRADRLGDGTVFVDDSRGALDPAVARRLARQASHVVLVSTAPAVLEAFGLDVEPAAQASGDATVSTATCAIPAAETAGRITGTGTGYAVRDGAQAPNGTDLCAPTGSGKDRTWGLVRTTTTGGDVTLVGTTAAFRNDTITQAGNAALALGLLGGSDSLTWYTPTPGSPDAAPTLGTLAPPWVPSALGLLGLVALAAAFWRGRRLGPLVVEEMPVVVRAAETTEGRARLAARTRDRTHALDTLRVAAVRRTARRLGLPRSAHVDDVVRTAARATGIPDQRVGAVLVGGPTSDDRALIAGAAALDEFERAVLAATRGDQHPDRDHRGARP